MKTMMRFATAAFVTLMFVGCEGETKPAAPAGETKPATETKPAAPAKNAKVAAPTNTPSNKPID